jgi:hypothetical protein
MTLDRLSRRCSLLEQFDAEQPTLDHQWLVRLQ